MGEAIAVFMGGDGRKLPPAAFVLAQAFDQRSQSLKIHHAGQHVDRALFGQIRGRQGFFQRLVQQIIDVMFIG